jgi:hypothetical protein
MNENEKKLDDKMNAWSSNGLVTKMVENDVMKKILASEIMQSINKSIKPHFENIMKVL